MTKTSRYYELKQLCAGATALLAPSPFAPRHRPPSQEVLDWLAIKHKEWSEELSLIQDRLESAATHGPHCDCANCYFAELELQFRHGAHD